MLKMEAFDHIVVSMFGGQVSLTDVEEFAQKIESLAQNQNDLFLLLIPVNITGYPSKLQDVLAAAGKLKTTTGRVTRLYGVKYSTLMSFISNVTTQILRLKSNTVEAPTVDDLFKVIDKEADMYPNLKASWDKKRDQIKTLIAQYEAQAV